MATTILVVEDARDLADVIVRELQASGYRTQRAADGRMALKLHDHEHPDVVILDWMLPGLDGLETIRLPRVVSQTSLPAAPDDAHASPAASTRPAR